MQITVSIRGKSINYGLHNLHYPRFVRDQYPGFCSIVPLDTVTAASGMGINSFLPT